MHNYIKTKQVLGSGTYGEVTKAYVKNSDGSAGRPVAVKKLFLQKQATEGLDITALRDIKFLRELDHPNIIEVRYCTFIAFSKKSPSLFHILHFSYLDS